MVVKEPDYLYPLLNRLAPVGDPGDIRFNGVITRQAMWDNFRKLPNENDIKAYAFHDRIETSGLYPTQAIDFTLADSTPHGLQPA